MAQVFVPRSTYAWTVNPARQAFGLLHFAFAIVPLVAGLDKFLNILTDWSMYLSPSIPQLFGMAPQSFLYLVGIVEIIAGLIVAVSPRIGGYIVAIWLVGIIINLLSLGGYYDIALRDFGLCLGAIALARLSTTFATVEA